MTTFKTHKWLSQSGLSHGFFSRIGGVSSGIYDSLNAGYCEGDDDENVDENRTRIANAIGAESQHLLSCHQIHSTEVMIVDRPWTKRPRADAIVTKTPGIACTALAADCAPVLFADMENKVIGGAHAGWRGALAGVTDTTIAAMESLGAKRENITAIVGPCISQPNYEVGPEFRAQFPDNAKTFFHTPEGGREHFDLKAYVLHRLNLAGVGRSAALPDCTYGQPENYFSFRYNTHKSISGYGRNISAIMLT